MKYIKPFFRLALSDGHFKSLFIIEATHFEPLLDVILSEMHQFHLYHGSQKPFQLKLIFYSLHYALHHNSAIGLNIVIIKIY